MDRMRTECTAERLCLRNQKRLSILRRKKKVQVGLSVEMKARVLRNAICRDLCSFSERRNESSLRNERPGGMIWSLSREIV